MKSLPISLRALLHRFGRLTCLLALLVAGVSVQSQAEDWGAFSIKPTHQSTLALAVAKGGVNNGTLAVIEDLRLQLLNWLINRQETDPIAPR